MFVCNTVVDIYKKTVVIYEGAPPDDLPIELFYDTGVKFQVESSISLEGTNTITITGQLDGVPVVEEIICLGLISEGTSYFDLITSIVFNFEHTPYENNLKIRGITSNGNDNPTLMSKYESIGVRVTDVKWNKILQDMGVIFEKSYMVYLPIHIILDNSHVIEFKGEDYSIIQITRGTRHQELIMMRID